MKKLIKEPLLHFLLAGAAVFALYQFLSPSEEVPVEEIEEPPKILISQGQIDHQIATFKKVWQRSPTEKEVNALIEAHIEQEVYAREARKLGLDRNDSVIRQRLQQKMEFIGEEFEVETPTEDDLRAYLEENKETFRLDQRYTFLQVFLDPEKYGEQFDEFTTGLLQRLNREKDQADISKLGDSYMLPQVFTDEAEYSISSQLGKQFVDSLSTLESEVWQGPIASAYGAHLVYIVDKSGGRYPELEEVRGRVLREYVREKQEEAKKNFYQSLLDQYTVVVEESGDTESIPSKNASGGK